MTQTSGAHLNSKSHKHLPLPRELKAEQLALQVAPKGHFPTGTRTSSHVAWVPDKPPPGEDAPICHQSAPQAPAVLSCWALGATPGWTPHAAARSSSFPSLLIQVFCGCCCYQGSHALHALLAASSFLSQFESL